MHLLKGTEPDNLQPGVLKELAEKNLDCFNTAWNTGEFRGWRKAHVGHI